MKEEQRDIRTIDAEGQILGRLASQIATILIGKDKPAFESNRDIGDHIQVINASKMNLTGKKIDQKVYWHHTTHGQGLRMIGLKALWSRDPSDVLRRAVSRMLPKNKHRTERMKRLVVKN